LLTTSAKSWSSASALFGTPSATMLVAFTRTSTGVPGATLGTNTLSALLRKSATPPGTELAPKKLLPR
jgi:hypothetical protein